jgi:hypothetical protein
VWEVAGEDIHHRARAKEPRDLSSKQVVTERRKSIKKNVGRVIVINIKLSDRSGTDRVGLSEFQGSNSLGLQSIMQKKKKKKKKKKKNGK